MDDQEIALVAVASVGIVVAVLVEIFAKNFITNKHNRLRVSLFTAALFFNMAAFVPQFIENSRVAGATNDIRPSFLILITVSLLLKVPAERQMVRTARETNQNLWITIVQATGVFVPAVFYVVWQFQCAALNSDDGAPGRRKHILLASAIAFSIIISGLVYWTFSVSPRKTTQQLFLLDDK